VELLRESCYASNGRMAAGVGGRRCEHATAHAAAQTADAGVVANAAAYACLIGGEQP
jgi:hypothetical protein